jgi:hypothetical protein
MVLLSESPKLSSSERLTQVGSVPETKITGTRKEPYMGMRFMTCLKVPDKMIWWASSITILASRPARSAPLENAIIPSAAAVSDTATTNSTRS